MKKGWKIIHHKNVMNIELYICTNHQPQYRPFLFARGLYSTFPIGLCSIPSRVPSAPISFQVPEPHPSAFLLVDSPPLLADRIDRPCPSPDPSRSSAFASVSLSRS